MNGMRATIVWVIIDDMIDGKTDPLHFRPLRSQRYPHVSSGICPFWDVTPLNIIDRIMTSARVAGLLLHVTVTTCSVTYSEPLLCTSLAHVSHLSLTRLLRTSLARRFFSLTTRSPGDSIPMSHHTTPALSNSARIVFGRTRCPWYFRFAHVACAPVNPRRYASMNRCDRL